MAYYDPAVDLEVALVSVEVIARNCAPIRPEDLNAGSCTVAYRVACDTDMRRLIDENAGSIIQ
jgi:hypothetical protein